MKQPGFLLFAIPVIGLLVACGEQASQNEVAAGDTSKKNYVVLEESLQQLKDDFNAEQGKIRLLFIVGDTCGICLRGMADLNDAFIARAQNDERLVTFVVHVPALGAKEKHVPDAIPLLDGPRVFHYWDGVGKSGIHFGDTLETKGMYAWDVWLAYGPNAQWLETVPPKPEFWMHQLGPLPSELKLDAELFAEKALALMNTIEAGDFAELIQDQDKLYADGSVISIVAQPVSVAIKQHIRGKGGYQNLKSIKSITQTGSIIFGSESLPVRVNQDVENGLSRKYGDSASPLPDHIEKALADSWNMHGLLFEWKAKGHKIRKDGMQKVGKSLAWKLLVLQANGMRRAVYVDSHTGDIVLATYRDNDGQFLLSLRASDFRAVEGFRFPFQLDYLDADDKVIATEIFDAMEVESADFEEVQSGVIH